MPRDIKGLEEKMKEKREKERQEKYRDWRL